MKRQHSSAGPWREPATEGPPVRAAVGPPRGRATSAHDAAPGRHGTEAGADARTEADDRAAFAAVEWRERGAIETFVRRFHPTVLAAAHRVGVPPARRDEFAGDVLADVVRRLALDEVGREPPRRGEPGEVPLRVASVSSPRAYLTGYVQKRYAEERRQGAARQLHEEALAREGRPQHEGAVAATCSENALRESEGPLWEGSPLAPAIRRLAAAMRAVLTDEQGQLLDMLTYGASYQEIGRALDEQGGPPGAERPAGEARRAADAAKQRVYRLRKRLARVAFAYAADPGACRDADYPHVRRLLRRSGFLKGAELGRLALVRCGGATPYAPPEDHDDHEHDDHEGGRDDA